jgi:GWxTD domain-containing protein
MKSFLLLVLLAPAVFADGLIKYKDWDTSPQGYFMTKSERARWAEIKGDGQAEQFVNQFIAARPAGFVADVAKRAEMADKYLTVGKTPGSKTLRGKVVILLGPPSALNVSQRTSPVDRSMRSADLAASAGNNSGPSMADMSAAAQREGMSGGVVNEYAFTYAADKLPATYGKPLRITVLVDPSSGKDRFAERKQAAELSDLFELVAASRIAATPSH